MKKKAIISVGVIIAVMIVLGIWVTMPWISYRNNKLQEQVCAISKERVTLNEVVPFEWDRVYTFAPYTPKGDIEAKIGIRSRAIQVTVNERMVHLIFVKGNSVVASVCGYDSNLGYRIDFDEKVEFSDNKAFKVTRKDGLVILTGE